MRADARRRKDERPKKHTVLVPEGSKVYQISRSLIIPMTKTFHSEMNPRKLGAMYAGQQN